MAQAFQLLGCQVTLFHNASHILNREDDDAAEIVQQTFIREGIRLVLNCKFKRVEKKGEEKIIYFETEGKEGMVVVDEILVGAGRIPNVDGLNLEAVGVRYDKKSGVMVNDTCRRPIPASMPPGIFVWIGNSPMPRMLPPGL